MMFSIIIPVYNIEMYIKQCLNSVLSQTLTDYELILVDDGSDDNSGKICDEFAQQYKRIVVIHQENKGQAQARNTGILAAKGEYILFLDGDDYWYGNDNLQKLSQKISECGTRLDIVAYGGVSVYSVGEKNVFSESHMNRFKENDGGYQPEDFFIVQMKENESFYWYSWLYAFSRKLFVDYKLYFPCGRKYEDMYLTWRILLNAGRIGVMSDIFYVYRRNRKDSTTQTTSFKYLMDFIWVIEQNICDVKREKMGEEVKSSLLNNFSKNYFLCCGLSTFLKGREKKDMIARLKKDMEFMEYADGKKYRIGKAAVKIIGFRNLLRMQHLRICLKRYRQP